MGILIKSGAVAPLGAAAITTGEIVNLATIADLKLWLDARRDVFNGSAIPTDTQPVTRWRDAVSLERSGEDTNPPAYDADHGGLYPAVVFDGANDILRAGPSGSLINHITAGMTVMVAAIADNNNRLISREGLTSTANWFYNRLEGFGVAGCWGTTWSASADGALAIWGGTYTHTDKSIRNYLNGALRIPAGVTGGTNAAGVLTVTATPTYDATSVLAVGARDSNTLYLAGKIFRVAVWTRVLTTTERQKVEGQWAHELGLTASLPVGHPYKDFA